MGQQGIITLGTIMDNYLTNKVFYTCLDFFEHNVLFILRCDVVKGNEYALKMI